MFGVYYPKINVIIRNQRLRCDTLWDVVRCKCISPKKKKDTTNI